MRPPILRLDAVSKSYGGAPVLRDVSLDFAPGEIHALMGANGAGKSTLIRIVSGVTAPTSGRMLLREEPVRFRSAVDARRAGIHSAHQETEFFPDLSIAENLALGIGLPPTRFGFVDHRGALELARRIGGTVRGLPDGRRSAGTLSAGQRQWLLVAAALESGGPVILLDEPTSSLSGEESEWLFARLFELRAAGAAILYVSHRQAEIARLADRISVLRGGALVASGPAAEFSPSSLLTAMFGDRLGGAGDTRVSPVASVGRAGHDQPEAVAAATTGTSAESDALPARKAPRFEAFGLTDRDGRVRGVSLRVDAGEVVGLYGLVGAGRTELARLVFGLDRAAAGTMVLDEEPHAPRDAREARRSGVGMVPEDRLRDGVFAGHSIRANGVIAALGRLAGRIGLGLGVERRAADRLVAELAVRCRSSAQPIRELSGGNQQKVMFGRWHAVEPRLLILDEPTRGVDIASRGEIRALIRAAAGRGAGVLAIDSDLDELLATADRILVFREGRVVGEFPCRPEFAVEIARAALPDERSNEATPDAGRADDLSSRTSEEGSSRWGRLPSLPSTGVVEDRHQRGPDAPRADSLANDTSTVLVPPTPPYPSRGEGSDGTAPSPSMEQCSDGSASPRPATFDWSLRLDDPTWPLAAVCLMGSAGLALTTPAFLSVGNLHGVVGAVSLWVILALGAALPIVAGGIDISLGSIAALSAGAAGLVLSLDQPDLLRVPLALLVGSAVGAVAGGLNGTLAVFGRIHPVIVTLGTLTIFRGLLRLLFSAADRTILSSLPAPFRALALGEPFALPANWSSAIGLGNEPLAVPAALLAVLVIAGGTALCLSTRPTGRRVVAYGSSPVAARLVGISGAGALLPAFALGGLLAALGGMFELARGGSMQVTFGQGYELRAISAAVIGGTSIQGGRIRVRGIVLGALLLGLIENALVLRQVPPTRWDTVIGLMLLAAVVLDRQLRGRRSP